MKSATARDPSRRASVTLMSAQLEVTSRVLVPAEAERVWQVAMDWSRQREWMWGTQVRGGTGIGAEVVARTGIGPVGFADTMVITEWDPPRLCVVRHTGRIVRGLGIFEVTGSGQQTEFRWTERLQLPWPLSGRLGRWMVVPPARWGLDASLRRLARLL
jgi:carbon monoxide dehydrogenase subunit G